MEFQAVVMAAGRGSRMTDLTSTVPKALQPIGNKPMLWYPINMLERAGFEDVIIIVLDSFREEAYKQLGMVGGVKIRLDFVSIPDSDFMGTADSLRHIKDKIKRDVMLVSCDLITDVSLHHIANLYRTYDATVTMFLCNTPENPTDCPVPGPKSKKRTEKDFVGFDEKGSRVLFMTSEADLEEDTVQFRKSVLKKHPNINIRSNLSDCHLYLMKKWVVDYLANTQLISSLKGELIPHLVRKQFSKPKKPDVTNTEDSLVEETVKTDIYSYIPKSEMGSLVQEMSTWIDHTGDMSDCFHGDQIRCYAYVVSGKFCVRTNTVATYYETNRQILKLLNSVAKDTPLVHPSVSIKERSQVGSDSLVAEGVSIGEKVSIKKSVIGKHCTIADKVKITNSVVQDYVHIGEGCNIQGSVVCSNSHISDKCELKDCIVGGGQTVQANSKFTNEAIVEMDKMIEI